MAKALWAPDHYITAMCHSSPNYSLYIFMYTIILRFPFTGSKRSNLTMPLCTKQDPCRNIVSRLEWKNSSGLHRALVEWSGTLDVTPAFLIQHQPFSILGDEYTQIHKHRHFKKQVEGLPSYVDMGMGD